MAENEYLDSTKARRCLSLVQGMRDGCDLDELTRRALKAFYKALRQIHKEMRFAEMIAALPDRDQLLQVCEPIEGGADVKDHLIQAAVENHSVLAILRQFLRNAVEHFLYDIPHFACEHAGAINLTAARRNIDEVRRRMAPELDRIAEKWSEKPSWYPRHSRTGQSRLPPRDHTQEMLSHSLLTGNRK